MTTLILLAIAFFLGILFARDRSQPFTDLCRLIYLGATKVILLVKAIIRQISKKTPPATPNPTQP
jgi:hypothetical protein